VASLLRRIARRSEVEKRFSVDQWLTDYLIPSQFSYGGTTYPLGLNQTLAGERVQRVAGTLPGYAAALRSCPPAFAAQMVRALVLSQARCTWRNLPSSATPRRTFGNRELSLLERPWPHATTGDLLSTMEWHSGLAGNSYVARRPDRLQVLRPDWCGLVFGSEQEPEDAATALDGELLGLVYQNGGFASPRNTPRTLLPGEFAHWSQIPDPECPGMGQSWVTAALADIQSDQAATQHKFKFFVNGAPQPYDAGVLTPDGWVEMGSIKAGDRVFGSDGKPKTVLAVYPQGIQDIYRVTFSSGGSTECTADHLWTVANAYDRKRGVTRTATLAELVANGIRYNSGPRKWSVPLADPMEFDDPGDLPIHPYLLGSLLGDGSFRSNGKGSGGVSMSAHRDDVDEQQATLSPLLPEGVTIVRRNMSGWSEFYFRGVVGAGTTCRVDGCTRPFRAFGLCSMHYQRPDVPRGQESRTNPLTRLVKALGIWDVPGHEKSIPEVYLRASVTQRVALLQGLVDTDGSVQRAQPNTVQFDSTSERLARQVAELVGSLGGIASVRAHRLATARARVQWRVSFSRLPEWITPCRLARKAVVYNPNPRGGRWRYIQKVEHVGRKPAQCIGIDSEDHLYVTDDFILTHNTPNMVVKGIPALSIEEFTKYVDMLEDRHTGLANAYRTLYLTAGADATVVGSDLRQLDFKATQGAGETRIAFLGRVPAPLLGISEGLAGSSLNAGNFGMARRIFADSWIYPSLQDVSASLESILTRPRNPRTGEEDAELWFDTVDMPLLREDAKDAAEIESIKALTIGGLVKEGFTPESSIAAVMGQNMSLLSHSGLVSVQLQPPGASALPNGSKPAALPAGKAS